MTLPFQGARLDLPSGAIIPWEGPGEEVPPGWVYCDGNNGSPDLRARFPKSVPDSSTDPGATGGTNSQSLSTAEMPSHSHSGSIDQDGAHSHDVYNRTYEFEGGTYYLSQVVPYGDSSTDENVNTSTNGAHTHPIDLANTGSGFSFENRPKYRELSFIQKL